jgi:hypothetical protein
MEALAVYFKDGPAYWASESQRIFRERRPYSILVATYEPAWFGGYGVHGHDARWSVWITPVLRESRHLANTLLRQQGLPALARWLRLPKPAGWDQRTHRLDLVFDPIEESLTAQEASGA